MCLQAMTIVYGRYFEDIGPFADTKYIVQMLDRVSTYVNYRAGKSFFAHILYKNKLYCKLIRLKLFYFRLATEWNGIDLYSF